MKSDFLSNVNIEEANRIYWGTELDNGADHVRKIAELSLRVDKIAAFNHLAIFFRWAAEHDLLSERLDKVSPNLRQMIADNRVDVRYVISEHAAFNGKLRTRHFNKTGKDFAKHYYTFYKNGFAHCVDKYAEKVFGTEKYNCEEYKNEAYLFLTFDETYYRGLSEYIDEAYEEFCRKEKRPARDMISLCAVCDPFDKINVWEKWLDFCLHFEKNMRMEFTHINCEGQSLYSKKLKIKKRCIGKADDAAYKKELMERVAFYVLPEDYEQAAFDYKAYMSLCCVSDIPTHCEITMERQLFGNGDYRKWINELSGFLKITEVEVNLIPDYAVFNYNKNCMIMKTDGYYDTNRVNRLYRRREIINTDIKREIEDIKKAIKKSAIIFETGGKRPTKELLESWIGRVGWKAANEEIPKDLNGDPMIPLMSLFIKALPYIPEVIKNVELITVFVSKDVIEECVFEDKDFVVRTYTSLEKLEACEWQTDCIKAFPLIPKLIEDDYPEWDSEDIPETIREKILELENVEKIDYFEDIAGAGKCFHKIGGYPSYIQSGIAWEKYQYVFQIVSDEKADFCFGDCGNIYFFYNKDEKRWGVHYDYY